MKKQTEKYLLAGAAILGIGYLIWRNKQTASAATVPSGAASAANATSSAPSATPPAINQTVSVAPPTPTLNPATDILWGIANIAALQQPIYNLAVQFAIQNNGGLPATINSLTGSFTWAGVTVDYATATPPAAPAGNLGTINWNNPAVVQPGKTWLGWVQVQVPKNAGTNYYLTTLNDQNTYAASHGSGKGPALTFIGTAVVNGQSLPLSVSYIP